MRGDRDPNDLAGATLENKQVTNADEVDRNWHRFTTAAATARFDDADLLPNTLPVAGRPFLYDDLLTMVVVVMREWVEKAISSTLNSTAEGVVATIIIVVTHFAVRSFFLNSLFRDLNFGGRFVVSSSDFLNVVGVCSIGFGVRLITSIKCYVYFVAWVHSTAVFTLSDVKLGFESFVLSSTAFFTSFFTVVLVTFFTLFFVAFFATFFKTTNWFTISIGGTVSL